MVISWSSYPRLDFYLDTGWQTMGNIFLQYNTDMLNKIWSLEGAVQKSWCWINAAIELLESKNVNFCFISLDDMLGVPNPAEVNGAAKYFEYQRYIPNYFMIDYNRYFCSKSWLGFIGEPYSSYYVQFGPDTEPRPDGHPTMQNMYHATKMLLYPKLGLADSTWMSSHVDSCHNALRSIPYMRFGDIVDISNSITKSAETPITRSGFEDWYIKLDNQIQKQTNTV